MKEFPQNNVDTVNEMFIVETLNLNNKTILDLGCSNAKITYELENSGFNREIYACEIDLVQHKINTTNKDTNIKFFPYGAQDLKFEDNTFDIIFMFKSFHHINVLDMVKALKEIKRVLKPNALVYISEPLYSGKQNELVSIFHDEKLVREEAYKTIKSFVDNSEFKLFKEIFFNTEVTYTSFEDFEKKQMNLSYNENSLNEKIHEKVKNKYEEYSKNGQATFLKPFRVNILQKI